MTDARGNGVRVERRKATSGSTALEARNRVAEERLKGYTWSNRPGDRYALHTHTYDKVISVLRGSITFGLPEMGEHVSLGCGDRLFLPAMTQHDAVVGGDGVECFEAHVASYVE